LKNKIFWYIYWTNLKKITYSFTHQKFLSVTKLKLDSFIDHWHKNRFNLLLIDLIFQDFNGLHFIKMYLFNELGIIFWWSTPFSFGKRWSWKPMSQYRFFSIRFTFIFKKIYTLFLLILVLIAFVLSLYSLFIILVQGSSLF